jgi:pimeloyl-ACP methyl ester carboxylesterase
MYWLYQPAAPTPLSAPVVLFLHGLNGSDPYFYGGWIDHIVRRGDIVIYPVYQTSALQSTKEMLENAIQATSDAIDHLTRSGLVRPQLEGFAMLGHSFGGGLAVQIAARAEKVRLPMPKAIMAVQPGWKGNKQMPTDELTEIPPSVLMLIVDGDEDQFAKTRQGKTIFCRTNQILLDRKKYVVLQSDYHGSPPLIADHMSPLAPQEDYGIGTSPRQEKRREFIMRLMGLRNGEEDALDYFGYWRLFDALFDAALRGKNIDAVIGSERDLSMGQWSDGTPVKLLQDNAPQCAP